MQEIKLLSTAAGASATNQAAAALNAPITKEDEHEKVTDDRGDFGHVDQYHCSGS
jgi:hypothetical protein